MFRKILIANRGEIAVRVIRTCREMGIPTAAVFSDADRTALHVRMADEAVRIGPAAAAESYLSIERILDAAGQTGADAVHPGYGFLSENPDFAEACGSADVKFIGPSAPAMRLMGSKTRAREMVEGAGVPVVPGTTNAVKDPGEALRIAAQIGFPVMLKASAGGGGKGMRLVRSANGLESALSQARGEARAAFGNGDIYIEKAIESPRHVEVQILADEHGHVIHLGERECSLQRRHQKVVEEAPSPLVDADPALRENITTAAVRAARAAGYSNAGTVEFLMDRDRNFFFLEMNTRLQVEHPVTEMVTGLDLVKEQILIAAGEPLRYEQKDIRHYGSAIECRIYAEDPANDFLPSPGLISAIERPSGPGVRVDSGAYAGWRVPIEYDPLIAKLVVWAPTRPEAIARLRGTLAEYHIAGIRTTIGFFRDLAEDPDFCAGVMDTGFIERFLKKSVANGAPAANGDEEAAILAAGLHFQRMTEAPAKSRPSPSPWRAAAKQASLRGVMPFSSANASRASATSGNAQSRRAARTVPSMKLIVELGGVERELIMNPQELGSTCRFTIGGSEYIADVESVGPAAYSILIGDKSFEVQLETIGDQEFVNVNGRRRTVAVRDPRRSSGRGSGIVAEGRQEVCSPMPGKLIEILVVAGEEVDAGQGLVIVEAMKMQNEIRSPKAGRVTQLPVELRAPVAAGDVLAVVE